MTTDLPTLKVSSPMISRLFSIVEEADYRIILLVSATILLFVAVVDLLSGEEIASSIFYLLPVAVVAWRFDSRVAGGFAFGSALIWLIITVLDGIGSTSVLVIGWNGFSRFLLFLAFSMLIGHVRASLMHARALALTDHLTGVANGRQFAELAQRELEHCRRHRRPFTLAYIDIDDFKDVNDAVGHSGGDRVIRAVARALESSVRRVDKVARQGGDEFMLFLHEVDGEHAPLVLEKIHDRVGVFLRDEGVDVSLSIGGVTWNVPPATLDAAIQSADRMMYEVKRTRKGTVMHRSIGELQPAASRLDDIQREPDSSMPKHAPPGK